jgi:hypothetical protein
MKNYKKMNMTQKKGLIILGILLMALIFSAWFFLNGQRPSGEINKDVGSSESALTTNEPEVEQKSSATIPAEKVTIKAYLNLGACGKEVTDLLDGLVKEYQGRVSVEYIDFGTREGYNRMTEDGLNCQGLVINGKQTYAIIDKNGAEKDVKFSHPINAQYTADDLKTVIKMLLGE